MSQNRRTFPRIPVSTPGLLEFTPAGLAARPLASQRRPLRQSIMVASAACEGLRLFSPDPVRGLAPGMRVDVSFHIGDHDVALPGEVAWTATGRDGATHVGVALHLELAPAATRQRWSEWIVGATRTAQQRALPH